MKPRINFSFCGRKKNDMGMMDTLIMDMDGVLIDSEPLWEMAGKSALSKYGIQLTTEDYYNTTGLRTQEWLEHWYMAFRVENANLTEDEALIVEEVVKLVQERGEIMPGVEAFLSRIKEMGIKIGLATSSPLLLAEVVVEKLNLEQYFEKLTSAAPLDYGKPHPQVYLECAAQMGSDAVHCACVEDSINGMIAAKAAKMKCMVVPLAGMEDRKEWGIADFFASSLHEVPESFFEIFSRQ